MSKVWLRVSNRGNGLLYVKATTPQVGEIYWMEVLHERTKTLLPVLVKVQDVRQKKGLAEVTIVGSDNTCLWEEIDKLYTQRQLGVRKFGCSKVNLEGCSQCHTQNAELVYWEGCELYQVVCTKCLRCTEPKSSEEDAIAMWGTE